MAHFRFFLITPATITGPTIAGGARHRAPGPVTALPHDTAAAQRAVAHWSRGADGHLRCLWTRQTAGGRH